MQAPTHIMAGVVLGRIFQWRHYRAVSVSLTIILALFLHGIFDKLGMVTYHPVATDFTDPFWLGYQVVMALTALVLIYMFWADYKLAIVFSLLPDIDWIVLHTANAFNKEVIFYKTPLMHDALNYVLDNIIPFSYLNTLPDLRTAPWACVLEFAIFGVLVLLYRALLSRRRNIHF
ncbi:MAG: hypothetical protein JST83_07290 [Bacteroidetes bacterium]|nr:hypothetical protein [Bacteroidota bacterium]